jgi:hypothetical protein
MKGMAMATRLRRRGRRSKLYWTGWWKREWSTLWIFRVEQLFEDLDDGDGDVDVFVREQVGEGVRGRVSTVLLLIAHHQIR